jgi:transposase
LFDKKRGCSSSADRIPLIQKFIKIFGPSSIRLLLADREFLGKEWIEFLQSHSIPFVIRLRENQQTLFCEKRNRFVTLSEFLKSLKKGQTRFLGTKVFSRKNRSYEGYITAKKNKNGKIIAVLHSKTVENPIDEYKKRWSIEVGFKNLKSNGFNLEKMSLICPDRIQNLMNVVLLSFSLLVKKSLSIQKGCEASSLAEASQPFEEEDLSPPRRRESFFKKALSELTRDLTFKRSSTLKEIFTLFIEALDYLNYQKSIV